MGICGQSTLRETPKRDPNEIYFEVIITEEHINKEIYFLDNIDFTDPKSKIKHNHDFLKELNSDNTKLYINFKRTIFKKYFTPNQKGIHRFKLEFDNDLTDCSYMFYNCKNLLRVDFSKFRTNKINDISYMFYC